MRLKSDSVTTLILLITDLQHTLAKISTAVGLFFRRQSFLKASEGAYGHRDSYQPRFPFTQVIKPLTTPEESMGCLGTFLSLNCYSGKESCGFLTLKFRRF